MTIAAVASAAAEEAAEVPLGLWQTEPDQIGVVLLVRTRSCGRALCARVERAKNRRGYDAPSDAVGQQVLWSMKPQPDGAFFGEYRDTAANRYPESRVEVSGKKLRLLLCNDQGCGQSLWTRVK
jgi:uncharacterized protein (DUF2147 family)